MAHGLFITFEGGEGAGKTTQIKRLAAALGDNCITTREPGGTPEADALRDVFVTYRGQDWPPQALLLLMFAARALHTERVIKPALEKGTHVICDRYTDSTRVYQGYAGGHPLDDIEKVREIAIGHFEPDVTFILDIAPEEGLRRAGKRGGDGDTFESRDLTFHEKLRQGYLEIARKTPTRCIVIDAAQDEETIAAQILAEVRKKL